MSEPDTAGRSRPSGDAALAAAVQRSESADSTTALNLGDAALIELPVAADTANLRLGAPLDDVNLPLLPLIGVWRGEGKVHVPDSTDELPFGQQLTISHDGRGVLRHESVTWLLDSDGVATADERELGWWRPQPDGVIELVVASSNGVVEVFYGAAQSLSAWSFGTDAVVRTTSAPPITGATRLYGIVEGKLAYVVERATTDTELQPHTSALLERIVG